MINGQDVQYRKSDFLQVVTREDDALIWHSLFGNPLTVSCSVLALLEVFQLPLSLAELNAEYEIDTEQATVIDLLVANHMLVRRDLDERAMLAKHMKQCEPRITSGQMIDYLELIISEACNFRCTYCIHFNNLETSDRIENPKKFMTLGHAKEIVDAYLDILRKHKKIKAEINFGGGEPLLAWPVVRQVLEYCIARHGADFSFDFSINTNASLITPDIARTLKQYRVSVAVSLDGLWAHNDRVRIKRSGEGTFKEIVRGMEILEEVGYPLDGFAVTLNEHNFAGLNEDLIDWAQARNMKEVRVDTDVVDMVDIPINDIVSCLSRIRRYAHSLGIDVPGFWSRPFENLNYSTLEEHVAFCGAVRGNSMCVSPSGEIYGCGYSTTKLGSLVEIESFHAEGSNYHGFVRDRLTGIMAMCHGCMIEGQCGGGCNITQEFARARESSKIERMCEFYRGMTRELAIDQLRDISERKEVMRSDKRQETIASNVS
jgi:uncharacterized protein